MAEAVLAVESVRVEADFGLVSLLQAGVRAAASPQSGQRRVPTAKGEAMGRMQMSCQRCQEPVMLDVIAGFDLLLVDEKVAAELPLDADVRIIADGQTTLAELVEDEMLLALPAQVCALQACPNQPRLAYPASGADEPKPAVQRVNNDERDRSGKQWKSGADNPFAGLASLKEEMQAKKT